MEQHELVVCDRRCGIGHNAPPDTADPGAALAAQLAAGYGRLVGRFLELELGCGRVPDPIATAEEAGLVTDFVAQCQVLLRQAERAHKQEKAPFLTGGRVVDGFFKRRSERLGQALIPVLARLKAFRDRLAASEAARRLVAQLAAEEERHRACDEAARHRAAAEGLACDGEGAGTRARAAQHLRLADAAAERAREAAQRMALEAAPVRIEGDYGAVAYVTHNWSFEVVDLAAVPRVYLALDNERVRAAITRERVREIPGLRIFEREELRVRGGL